MGALATKARSGEVPALLQGGGEALTFCDIRLKAPIHSPTDSTFERLRDVIEVSQYVKSAVHPQMAVGITGRPAAGRASARCLAKTVRSVAAGIANTIAKSMMAQ